MRTVGNARAAMPLAPATFLARVAAGEDCWLWTGYIERNGYGRFGSGWAHRLAFAYTGQPMPDGLDVRHSCDNRRCVNPAHLSLGTRAENMADCSARDRHNKPRGEGHWRARLTAADVAAMRERRSAGATNEAIAHQFGVHPATVSRIVRGIWRTEVPA